MCRFRSSLGCLPHADSYVSLKGEREVRMRQGHGVSDPTEECRRCSDLAAARGGWGLTTRYCVILEVRVVVLLQAVMLMSHMARLSG